MTIIFRVLVGVVCDILGARRGLAFLLFLACPGIVGMMSATAQGCVVGPEVEISCVGSSSPAVRIPVEQKKIWASRCRGNVSVLLFWSHLGAD